MSTGIAIVWPAWFLGSADPQLHATALFLGDIETTKFKREDIQEVLDFDGLFDPGACRVTGTALFGRDKNVPVLTIESPVLNVAQAWLTRELGMLGIVSPSEFGFNPHVTIAKEAAKPYFPHFIQLEAPVLWWGDDRPIHSKHQKTLEAV
jgi:2'-5' RNA ligase